MIIRSLKSSSDAILHTRNTYDKAAEHVYLLLLKKDCYPRFIRSEHYKNLLANAINPGNARKR